MKALVTGSTGFSGGYICQHLLERGWEVVATGRGGLATRLGNEPWVDKVTLMEADLNDKDSLKKCVQGVDVVFHTAALFSYSASMDVLRKVNVEGTENLIQVSMDAGVKKMVMWSSVALYGSADPKFYELPIRELPHGKLNPDCEGKYDLSKREQEALGMQYWNEHQFPVTFLRSAPMYGPGSYYGIYTLFYYVKRQVLPAAFRNLHNASVPLVHVKDIANAAVFLSDTNKFNGEAYNLVDDNNLDMIQTLRFLAHLTGSKIKTLIPLPIQVFKPFLKIFGKFSKWEADHLRKKVNGKPQVPKLETDTILYMFGNFWFSNAKLKEAGYEFIYPDRRPGLLEVVDWYNEHGWKRPGQ